MKDKKILVTVTAATRWIPHSSYNLSISRIKNEYGRVSLGEWEESAGRGSTIRSILVEYKDIPALVQALTQALLEAQELQPLQ